MNECEIKTEGVTKKGTPWNPVGFCYFCGKRHD